MLNCGALLTRTGALNASGAIGSTGGKGGDVRRQFSTIARNKFPRLDLLRTTSHGLANANGSWSTHSSYARSLCLRKLRSRLPGRSASCTTTGVGSNLDAGYLPKRTIGSSGGGGGDENVPRPREGGSERLNLGNLFDEVAESVENRMHARKEHALRIADIDKLYPNAKSKVHEIYMSISSQLKQGETLKAEFAPCPRRKKFWVCEYKVKWPEDMTITATASSKSGASRLAALKCLQWLHNEGKLNNGQPIVYSNRKVAEMLNKPTPIAVSPESMETVKFLLGKYNTQVRDIIENSNAAIGSIRDISLSGESDDNEIDPVGRRSGTSCAENMTWSEYLEKRNDVMLNRLNSREPSAGETMELPIAEFRDKILREIENNQALLIKGDTGCGKTTQVPQFIMDSLTGRGEATNCNMIVSQPRRISAISLAERIAYERNEQVGDAIGYQVRLQQILPQTPGGMLFCTTGILLRKMQSNPSLRGCSHVILDEAHERSINTDMLLVLLKRALQNNPTLKVIVMSATINADLFQRYFNCNVVEVPGKTHRVDMHFLEDVEALGIPSTRLYAGGSVIPEIPFVDCEQIGELISWIANNKPPGAILCFLPGWAEIVKVKKYLEERRHRHWENVIVPVHSRMSHRDQRKIFEKPPPGVRKIVLATDIAETGITVADVVYVVDSATRKAMKWHEKKGVASMENQYAAQANILQRKGRAGRVQPGTSYHLVTRTQFQHLDVHPLPEVLCSSLEKTVLDCKTYSSESAESFLGSMPQPPTKSAVRKALFDLQELGALDENENLTPLGKRIALFTVHPKLSKAMVYSTIFQCVAPMITIASVMSAENEIFTGTLFDKEAIRKIKQNYHPSSDHIGMGWIFAQWASQNRKGRESARKFCFQTKLYPERVFTLSKIRHLNADHLVQCHMLDRCEEYDDLDAACNAYAELDEMVRGVLLSGLDQLLYQRDFDLRKGRVKKGTSVCIMEDGNRATITPESVNFKRKDWPSPFLTYVRRQHSEERRTSLIRETSMVSPLTALLFSQARIHGFESPGPKLESNGNVLLTIKGRKNLKLSCEPEVAKALLQLRDTMWSVVRYLVEKHGLVDNSIGSDHRVVEEFKQELLRVIAKMLNNAAQRIDDPDVKAQSRSRDADEDSDE